MEGIKRPLIEKTISEYECLGDFLADVVRVVSKVLDQDEGVIFLIPYSNFISSNLPLQIRDTSNKHVRQNFSRNILSDHSVPSYKAKFFSRKKTRKKEI